MVNKHTQATERTALQLIRQHGISAMEAAQLIQQIFTALPGLGPKLARARKCVALGLQEMARQEKTVSFQKAVQETLLAKRGRRPRTVSEIRYVCDRLMRKCPCLPGKPVRAIRPEECSSYIRQAFSTPRQRYKARLILSGVFSTARKRGWCMHNPASHSMMDMPPPPERAIRILSLSEIERLKRATEELYGGECRAAFGLMTYAGIRPAEVTRLTWGMVDLEENVICLPARHSKTGGSRQVSIRPILRRLLAEALNSPETVKKTDRICPAGWVRKWKEVRKRAGWGRQGSPWIQDVLRHCYASYHAKRFRNFPELQYEMGHSCAALLRTRYLSMEGLTAKDAAAFWAEAV